MRGNNIYVIESYLDNRFFFCAFVMFIKFVFFKSFSTTGFYHGFRPVKSVYVNGLIFTAINMSSEKKAAIYRTQPSCGDFILGTGNQLGREDLSSKGKGVEKGKG